MYVYLPRTDNVQEDLRTHESRTLISAQRLEAVEATVELLEQELERAHERDRETRRLLAAALERIPPQLEAPAEPPQTVEQEPERWYKPADARVILQPKLISGVMILWLSNTLMSLARWHEYQYLAFWRSAYVPSLAFAAVDPLEKK